ncbi:Holliday junction ATP-dependent DNA helicase RuvA [Xylanibacillus composti]|uniref:Holliday junction branch migration complex subunit RuvA n=1 Tax=Xylanibacillus composti TaxID=1572762 RepID=A0A8J4H7T3_9BACL|nr:Holliday junction branch migration protein RuvA [Xylanibacillus composti]GIQ70143.1 Holliday junction ATP-dependent DNA helicase RuvA [Xylanibacillus composti]
MIDFLRGHIAHTESDYIVMDVNGVGYQVFCPNPYEWMEQDGEATIYTHHHVREDAILLYGFRTREEQALFRKLLDVSGIGPRVALGMLAGARPEAVVGAIQREDVAYLTKLPGIGRKTAQRLVLDLKDKLKQWESAIGGGEAAAAGAKRVPGGVPSSDAWLEAAEALKALGYSESEIDQVRPDVLEKEAEDAPSDKLMRSALQLLFRG